MMKINLGEKIQARARELKIGPSELGKLVNTSKQNMISVFKRESVDTLLLWKISKSLRYNFFSFYDLPEIQTPQEKERQKQFEELHKELKLLKRENQVLEEKNALLKKINALLENKRKK